MSRLNVSYHKNPIEFSVTNTTVLPHHAQCGTNDTLSTLPISQSTESHVGEIKSVHDEGGS